jgi:ribosomal protein L14E/L6E/L27E
MVYSKKGRDKGLALVVSEVENEYLYLVDGKTRTLQKPKKKKAKHVQPTHYIVDLVPSCGRDLQDADIRKAIREVSNVV